MLELQEAQARAAALVEAAVRAGADAADALYAGDVSLGVQVRLGALEDVGRSEGEEIGLRVFIGSRSASVAASDFSPDSIGSLVERAIAMAREAPEDPFAGLAPEDRLHKGDGRDLDSEDSADPSPERLKALALEMEEAARSLPGITNSEGAGYSAGSSRIALATSHGFCGAWSATAYSAGVSVLAGSGADMQRDHASHQARHFADLDPPETLGRLAAERVLARLNPKRIASAEMPVLFDPRVGGSLIGHLIAAMSGPAIARGASFLAEREAANLFPEGINIVDDPHLRRGLRSKPFDGEGVANGRVHLVERGRLGAWLTNAAAARQLGRETSGHATRGTNGAPGVGPTNVYVEPGASSPQALRAGIRRGLLVTELIGQGVNPVTGDYSRGAGGFLIEDGQIAGPIDEITIAGNLIDMFAGLSAADDLERRRSIDVPTLRIERMTVAGA